MRRSLLMFVVLLLANHGSSVFAASPVLSNILPRGAQRGVETEVLFNGLAARTVHGSSGNRLLQEAYKAILFQPPMKEDTSASAPTETSAAAPSPSAPTECIVYFSPVNKNNR